MQTDTSLTYIIPFFISVISWVKFIQSNRKLDALNKEHEYILSRMHNLECSIENNKRLIFEIDNQIDFVDKILPQLKNKTNFIFQHVDTLTKTLNQTDISLSQIEITTNERMSDFEERLQKLENSELHIPRNTSLKIINPQLLHNNTSYEQCQSPYNIINTSSSANLSSPTKTAEWIALEHFI